MSINQNELGLMLHQNILSKGNFNGKVNMMDQLETRIKSIRNGKELGHCKKEDKPIDFKMLKELRKQWEYDYKIDNGF